MIVLLRHSLTKAICLLCVLAISLAACKSSTTVDLVPDPLTPIPSIFGISPKNAANPGETLQVLGRNFGSAQGAGRVTLNGAAFNIVSWSDHLIEVTVAAGMNSGVITVIQNGRSSVSGQEAQLFIGQAPVGSPVIQAVTPAFGRIGQDEVSVVGAGFGAFSETAGVFFTAAPSHPQQFVKAQVSINLVTDTPQWTSTNIRVRVPAEAAVGAHELFVLTDSGESNTVPFEALPPVGQLGDPIITNVGPLSGPVGTEVIITGNNFDLSQGASTLTIVGPDIISAKHMLVTSWSNTQIVARIPEGATTGKLRLVIGGQTIEFPTDFVVANVPLISGVSPSDLRVGNPVTIFGQFFGSAPGTVQIGSSTFTPDSWGGGQLTINSLTPVNATDPDNVAVTVTNAAGLTSNPFFVRLTSDLFGGVTVNPTIGVATKTTFTFTISAAGGSGSYTYTLIPNINDPNTTLGGTAANQVSHIYQTQGSFTSAARIRDTATGDVQLIAGPTVTVRGPDDVVILAIETLDFGRPELAENEYSRTYNGPELLYNDFVFPAGRAPVMSAGTLDLTIDGNPLQAFTRNQAGFISGGMNPRPFGYRSPAGFGRVRIRGINFGGTTKGELWLRSTAPGSGIQIDPSQMEWKIVDGEDVIEFTIPNDPTALNGMVTVVNTTAEKHGTSLTPLIVSPFVGSGTGAVAADATLQINGNDLSAPSSGIPGIAGTQTYLFFVGQASYTDPFTDLPATGEVLFMEPYAVTVNNGQQINFPMATLMAGGAVNVQVPSASFPVEYRATTGTPQPGPYLWFIWSGALLDDGTNSKNAVANSGVFGAPWSFVVNPAGGGGGNEPPSVAIMADPDSGDAPLSVDFGALALDPDGNIVLYEWDFDGDGTYDMATGTIPSAQHIYTLGGDFDATVRVTDDGTPAETATDTITISVRGGPPGP